MQPIDVRLDDLLLDPNNYRFQDAARFRSVPEPRFGEESVQASALERLDSEGLSELKASIQHNGFLTIERIVVRPWSGDPNKFVVIEGNRRVAALRRLREDHRAGIDVNDDVLRVFDAVPVLSMDEGEPVDFLAIMGIRHVGGVRRWGPYQSAKLITEMRDRHELEFSDIASRLGLQTREVTRRYRAFKALSQMETDEEYGDSARRDMYPLFHEAVSQPMLREWLGWDDSSFEFRNAENRTWFYDLLSPSDRTGDDGVDPPRITTSAQVRLLKNVLSSEDAARALRDPSVSFERAHGLAVAEQIVDNWPTEIAEAVRALDSLPALALRTLDDDRVKLIKSLRDKASALLEAYDQLQA